MSSVKSFDRCCDVVDSEEQRVAVLLVRGPLLVLGQCKSVALAHHQELLVCDLPVLTLPHLAERRLADYRELVVGDEVAQDLSNHSAVRRCSQSWLLP